VISLGHCAPRGTRRSRGASTLLFMEVFQTERATLTAAHRAAPYSARAENLMDHRSGVSARLAAQVKAG
jgi:hypothetical protein